MWTQQKKRFLHETTHNKFSGAAASWFLERNTACDLFILSTGYFCQTRVAVPLDQLTLMPAHVSWYPSVHSFWQMSYRAFPIIIIIHFSNLPQFFWHLEASAIKFHYIIEKISLHSVSSKPGSSQLKHLDGTKGWEVNCSFISNVTKECP